MYLLYEIILLLLFSNVVIKAAPWDNINFRFLVQ